MRSLCCDSRACSGQGSVEKLKARVNCKFLIRLSVFHKLLEFSETPRNLQEVIEKAIKLGEIFGKTR